MPTNAYHTLAAAETTGSGTAAFLPGVVLQGTYRIVERLAVGGMGEVYVAAHERLPARVAVKVLQRELLLQRDAVARFGREALIMAALQHPHVAQVFEFNVSDEGTPYLVMELLEGERLTGFLDRREPVPPRRAATIIRQVASALDAAHARGIIHRDLKPANVMLLSLKAHDAFVKVFDFGISKVTWSNRLTRESTFLGTPEYMSPEQAQGRSDTVTYQTDQFALAAMSYALLTGREPFTGDSPLGVIYKVVNDEPPPLRDFVSWRAKAAEAVLRRGLAKRPGDRFPGVWSFASALAGALAAAEGSTTRLVRRPTAPTAMTMGWSRRRKVLTAAATTVAVTAGLCGAFLLAQGRDSARAQAGRLWRASKAQLSTLHARIIGR